MKVPLSIIIPVKNEAHNLPRCLRSISWAAHIFVVDSHSKDATSEISRAAGAQVVQFNYKGQWPKKKNWALENLPLTHEWVFILDADEVLPPGAETEFHSIVSDPQHPVDGYWINRRFMFMGKWLKHSYYPNWNLRLFKHKKGRYEKIVDGDTGSGDNEVHEHILLSGRSARLACQMDHYAFPSVDCFVEKHNRYSNWEAAAALHGHAMSDLQDSAVKTRRQLKVIARHLPCRPFLRFFYIYFWQCGFLDGREGYYFARLHAFYEFLSLAKTYELKVQRRNSR